MKNAAIYLVIMEMMLAIQMRKKLKEIWHKSSSGIKYCLNKMEKLAVPAKVALLQSANIWMADLGVSIHCMNDETGGINVHEGGNVGTMGTHSEATTASSIIDIARTWCNQFGEDQPKATLKDVQYDLKLSFNLFCITKLLRMTRSLMVIDKVEQSLSDIKIMIKNGVFSACICK